MTEAPTTAMLKNSLAGQLDGEETTPDNAPLDPEKASIKELTAYCKEYGVTPEGWTKMKAAEKRTAFRRTICPEPVEGVFDSSDKLHHMTEKVENFSKDEAKLQISRLAEDVGDNYFILGGIFARVTADGWFQTWGYGNFQEWLGAETDVGYRKAAYLIKIYNRLVELDVPWQKFGGIGWTKVIELLPVLSKDNADEWVDKAKNLTADGLKAEVASARRSVADPNDGAEETKVTKQKQFRLHADQFETVEAALDQMKEELPTEHDNVALEHISAAYLSGKVELADVNKLAFTSAQALNDLDDCKGALKQVLTRIRELTKNPYEACGPIVEVFEELFGNGEATMDISAGEEPYAEKD